MSNRVGLGIFRAQPLHFGHVKVIEEMLFKCDTVIVGLGSSQESRSHRNPFTFGERMFMIHRVFGSSVKVLRFIDIESSVNSDEWCEFVLETVKKASLPEPTDYFSGSREDAVWYQNRFLDFKEAEFSKLSDDKFVEKYLADGKLRLLHIVDRNESDIVPATKIRESLYAGTNDWKAFVPKEIHDIVEQNFQKNLEGLRGKQWKSS